MATVTFGGLSVNDVEVRHFVNGDYTPALSSEVSRIRYPATNARPETECPLGGGDDIRRAVAVAREAFDEGPWPRLSAKARAQILLRFAALIERNADDIAKIDTFNVGKLLKGCRQEAARGAENISYPAHALLGHTGEVFLGEGEFIGRSVKTRSAVSYEPVGVAGIIVPWNSPFMLGTFDIGPALAMGNTCVVKPPPWAPLSLLQLGRYANEAGIPKGVLNIVPGGKEAGETLVRHPYVDLVSFTGSVTAGKEVVKANAAVRLSRVLAELGGKAATIVFADADLNRAVQGAALSVFRGQGQSCVAGSRLLIEKAVYTRFITALVALAEKIVIGDPARETTHFGPLITAEHRTRVEGYIETGIQEGATLLAGGKRPRTLDPALREGNFIEPTIFADVDPGMTIFCEEIFGPVLSVLPFESEEEAIRLGNDTDYGLSGSVWTENGARGQRIAAALRVGMVWINGHFLRHHLGAPFGGMKQSGIGRKGGRWSMEFFSEPKIICATY